MEKVKTIEKKFNNKIITYYHFLNKFSLSNIYFIVDSLHSSGIGLSEFRLSNSDDSPEHFFRVLPTIKDFNTFSIDDDVYIDDFGVDCVYRGIKFSLTFDMSKNQVITIVDLNSNINLEPLLIQIEQMCQKKTR